MSNSKKCLVCGQNYHNGKLTNAFCEPHYRKYLLSNSDNIEDFIKYHIIKISQKLETNTYKGFCYVNNCINPAIKEMTYMDKPVHVCGTHFNKQSWKKTGEMFQKLGATEELARMLDKGINYGTD